MNVEWSVPATLISPQGSLDFNVATGAGSSSIYQFLLDPTKCLMGPPSLRTTSDDNPQGDGGIIHRSFRPLTLAKLGFQFWMGATPEDAVVACGETLREMYDLLMLHLEALVSPSQADLDGGNCRFQWSPSGTGDRILDRVQMLLWSNPTNDGILVADEFTIQCPFPYAIDLTQTSSALGPTSASTLTVTNAGTSPFYPVFRVHGPASTFFISNLTTGFDIFYLGSFYPGGVAIPGGSYAEIDTFRNTIYMNGNGANLKAGLAPDSSDFFPLAVGDNEMQVDADVDMLWNNAWA